MKNNKIGIVTFHRSHNCGSILQAYATQEVCRKYDLVPEFIDFFTLGQKNIYSVFSPIKYGTLKKITKSILINAVSAVIYKRLKRNWTSYDSYIQKYLVVSKNKYSEAGDIIETDLLYDMYLTGSDQVWNVTIDDYDEIYFLNFVHNHAKIAYAVSQGAKDINKFAVNPKEIARYIKDIDFVSVREENGQKWIKNLTSKNYPIVLDPTLLLSKEAYACIEEKHDLKNIRKGGFIFVYAAQLSREYFEIIEKYAKENNLKIVLWHNNVWLKRFGWLRGIICPKGQNPGKYLDLIKNAKFVCTSSFHGVAFSTIYRKNFVVLENDGMRAGDDDRMTGFLKRLKLSDRIVNPSTFKAKMNEKITYTEFEKQLEIEQANSFAFLDKAFGKNRRK